MQDHRTTADPAQLPLMPMPPKKPATGQTFWACRFDRKRSAMDNLVAATRYRRQHYGDELTAVHVRSELAALFPADTDLDVIANDRVSVGLMYCVMEENNR